MPVLILTVLGILTIAFMMQMPKEKPVHNVKRVIRGKPEAEVVDVVEVVEPVVDVKHPIEKPESVEVVEPVKPPKMKPWLSIVSVCIEGELYNREFIHTSLLNKQKWCEHNNAPCFLYDEKHYDHHPKWDKLTRIMNVLERNETDWVLWIDCDALFSNFNIPNKETLFDRDYDMITTKDYNGINLGTFLVKKTSIQLIQNMYSMKNIVDSIGGKKDQQALKLIMQKQHVSIKYVPQRYMNSFYKNDYGVKWQKGDWILHQVDCKRLGCTESFVQKAKKLLEHEECKTTLVIMGYSPKRIPNYELQFKTYGSMTNVIDKIIFIWNNQDVDPPHVPITDVPIQLLISERNSLNNRFSVEKYVTTSSIVSLDDDRIIDKTLLVKMMETHKLHPYSLIGPFGRSYMNDKYRYDMKGTLLILTGSALIPTEYLNLYASNTRISDYVDSKMCCEDIAMNFLISNNGGDKIYLPGNVKDLPEQDALSKKTDSVMWTNIRSHCIADLKKITKHMNI